MPVVALALLAAAAFGLALVITQFGLRHATPLAGATISITASTLVFWLLAPFALELTAWHLGAALIFAAVGLFYPAIVTLLTYESNRRLGPTLTGTVSSTAPLFATAGAVLVLGETLAWSTAVGGLAIVVGLVLMSLRAEGSAPRGAQLLLPLSGAALRGVAQILMKVGLVMWPNPYAATLLGYTASAAVVWSAKAARPGDYATPQLTRAVPWFVCVGMLNGSAMLLLYQALAVGNVSVVAPLVALYPLFTLTFSRVLLRTEILNVRTLAGIAAAVAGVITIVAG
jgi:uncharacterized membrane protein